MDRGPVRGRRRAGRARRGDGLPELRPLPAHDRRAEPGVRTEGAGCEPGGRGAPGGRGGRGPGSWRVAVAAPGPALRGTAAAGGAGARDGAGPRRLPLRRAALEPRRGTAAADARRDRRAAPAPRHDHDLRHARPGGGAVARGPRRGDGRRAAAAGGDAARDLPPTRQPLRRGVRGIAADQPAAAVARRGGAPGGRAVPVRGRLAVRRGHARGAAGRSCGGVRRGGRGRLHGQGRPGGGAGKRAARSPRRAGRRRGGRCGRRRGGHRGRRRGGRRLDRPRFAGAEGRRGRPRGGIGRVGKGASLRPDGGRAAAALRPTDILRK